MPAAPSSAPARPGLEGRDSIGPDPRRLAFADWFFSVLPEIRRVQELLTAPLSDNPAAMVGQLQDVERWYGRMTALLAYASSYYDYNYHVALPLKDKDRTAVDREAAADADTHLERRTRDELEGIVKAIQLRVSLGQSIIRANSQEGHVQKHES